MNHKLEEIKAYIPPEWTKTIPEENSYKYFLGTGAYKNPDYALMQARKDIYRQAVLFKGLKYEVGYDSLEEKFYAEDLKGLEITKSETKSVLEMRCRNNDDTVDESIEHIFIVQILARIPI